MAAFFTSSSTVMDYVPFMREPSLWDKALMTARYPIDLVARPFSALLSIPALSFFVIPAFSSYTTTINFLFFYLTWAVLIRSNDPLKVELLGSLGVRTVFYLLPSLAFLFFDTAAPSFAVSIKEHGKRALPTGKAQGGWKGRWWKTALVSMLNILLATAVQAVVELLCTRVLRVQSALKISISPPFPWTVAKDVALGLLLREVLTYVLHRYVLHAPGSRLTALHMAWQHSILAPFSWVAHYDHPLPYLVHIFLPQYLPAVILRMHLLTYHLYLAVVSLEETFAYSGYNVLPSGFILGGIARRQERHLMGEANGNYGCIGLADFFVGTSVGGDLVDDVVDEAEEQQVAKRAKGKAKAIKRSATKHVDPDSETDPEEPSHSSEETDKPAPTRRKSRRHNSSPNDEIESSPASAKRSSAGRSRRTKTSSDEVGNGNGSAETKENVGRPRRKASTAGSNGRRTGMRARKKVEKEEER